MKNLTPKQQQWLTTIDNWANSGLSQAEYCRQHNINLKAFYRWKDRLEKVSAHCEDKGDFVPLVIESQPSASSITLSIANVSFCYQHDTDPGLLKQLLHVLREVA